MWRGALLTLAALQVRVALAGSYDAYAPTGDGPSGIVYVIRHGEKIYSGDHLNRTGQLRAEHVAKLFGGGRGGRYTPPKAIFANFFNNENNSVELSTPLALKLGIQVNNSFHRPLWGENNTEATDAILGALAETGGPVMAVWESWNLVPVVQDLGCNRTWLQPYDGWGWGHGAHRPGNYDRFFILHLRNGQCEELEMKWEGFKNWKTWANAPPRKLKWWLADWMVLPILALLAAIAWQIRSFCKRCWRCSKSVGAKEARLPLLDA